VLQRGREQQLEQQSLLAVQGALVPWTVTWVDQRDDVGRDGFAQLFVTREDGVTIASGITCALQVKATAAPFDGDFVERLEVRHVLLWTMEESSSVIVFVWSQASGEIRARSARSIREELDNTKPGWSEQQSVSVRFRPEDAADSPSSLRARLTRRLGDELDSKGGRTRFHSRRRRGLILDLIIGTVNTSQTLSAVGSSGDEAIIEIGPGWQAGEIDPGDVFAPRVLSTGLFLYEEVWVPFQTLAVLLRILTPNQLGTLLRDERIVPFATPTAVGFTYKKGDVRGDVTSFGRVSPPYSESLKRDIDQFLVGQKDVGDLRQVIDRRLVTLPASVVEKVVDDTKDDLTRPAMRSLIGLSAQSPGSREPFWDAKLVNRLVHLNLAMAVANEKAIDVVEYEAGLSRLASEKWYSRLQFNHAFPTSDAFDGVLRGAGVPDVGRLENAVGMGGVLELANSQTGQAFRDWFWEEAASLVGSGAPTSEIASRFRGISGMPLDALKLATELKLRFVQQVGSDYILGSLGRGAALGYSCRSEKGRLTLTRQADYQRARRLQQIEKAFGSIDMYAKCPCDSGNNFRHCCGPKRSAV